ncbi:hypothetical protein CHS0354_009538 [Potamilus streckersoni]|uniref:RING-type domain-containing protein n=1 Tax=Potamilus streckersoni TaxID=2493646 RepID=A0AAE0SNX3_9BIVA|nr:hypothetical protein CHS0354_009538 [Potamilus streckersoni]
MAEGQDNMDKQLNCPICLETFESPKVLACLHTFCEKCISKHVSGLREEGTLLNVIACPVCRNPTPAPASDRTTEDWSSKLPSNYIVISLLESYHSKMDCPVYCQPCLTNDQHRLSVAYCVTCMEYLCETCHDCHKKFKVSKDHTITIHTLSDIPNLNPAENSMYRCSKHMKKYKYSCQLHKELCCYKCAFEYHKNCGGLFTLENLLKDTKNKRHNQTTLDYLDVLKGMFLTLIKHRTKTLESIPQQRTGITTTIKDLTKSAKDHIDQLELSTLQELKQICKQETLAISDQIAECKSVIAAIETSQKMLLELTKSNDEVELFTTTTKVSQHFLNYLRKYDTLERKSEEIKIHFNCSEPFEKMISSVNTIGQWSRETSPIPKLSSAFSFDKLAMLIPCAQPDSIVTLNAKLSDDKTDCNIYSGIFLHDGRILLSDERNKKLKLFDKCFHFSCHLNMVQGLRHICVVDQQNVAVTTSEKSIDIVAVTNTLTRIRTIQVNFNCFGITSCQHNIIVDIFQAGDSLLKYDTSFKLVEKIDSYDKLAHHCNTHCVTSDGENIYYTNGNKIVTMDKKGRRLNAFESDNLEKTFGVTLDRNGIIYCCGHDSNTVVLITPEGRELGVLLSCEHGLKKPVGICLNDTNSFIMVFEDASNEVKIFRLLYQ